MFDSGVITRSNFQQAADKGYTLKPAFQLNLGAHFISKATVWTRTQKTDSGGPHFWVERLESEEEKREPRRTQVKWGRKREQRRRKKVWFKLNENGWQRETAVLKDIYSSSCHHTLQTSPAVTLR